MSYVTRDSKLELMPPENETITHVKGIWYVDVEIWLNVHIAYLLCVCVYIIIIIYNMWNVEFLMMYTQTVAMVDVCIGI